MTQRQNALKTPVRRAATNIHIGTNPTKKLPEVTPKRTQQNKKNKISEFLNLFFKYLFSFHFIFFSKSYF